jgi:hypothetical protein
MISDQAARALGFISAIDSCKDADADFWRLIVTRIVTDLDEIREMRSVVTIGGLLAEMWRQLPEKPAADGEVQAAADAIAAVEDGSNETGEAGS